MLLLYLPDDVNGRKDNSCSLLTTVEENGAPSSNANRGVKRKKASDADGGRDNRHPGMDIFSFFKVDGTNAVVGDGNNSEMKRGAVKKRKSQVDMRFCIYKRCFKTTVLTDFGFFSNHFNLLYSKN